MKKLFLVAIATMLFSCSSDDAQKTDCTVEVQGMAYNCANQDCEYFISYGTNPDEVTTIQVEENVYFYYDAIFIDQSIEKVCWEGINVL